jgi:cellulose synthase/poly-beta-1,6-N-acetylglucosamine synthase-like glycosyltransferase
MNSRQGTKPMVEILFIIASIVIIYTYVGYPVLLRVLPNRPHRTACKDEVLPDITILIPAYNEERCIVDTLDSVLAVDYPPGKMEIVVISDASTDATDELVRAIRDSRIKLFRQEVRGGKYEALRAVIPVCETEILVFADASSLFERNALKRLVGHFINPVIGAITGSKRIMRTGSSVSRGDGLYWNYEALLRTWESRAGASWAGVEGGFFAIRKQLLQLDFSNEIAADYAICSRVYEQGYLHVYDPSASISEPPTQDMQSEFRRKIRVIVRGIRALFAFDHLLNPFTHPFFTFQNVSHRLLRWLVPFFLILAFISSALSEEPIIRGLFIIQCIFYLLAAIGGVFAHYGIRSFVPAVPLYFTAMNSAALIAWFQLTSDFTVWNPPLRMQPRTDTISAGQKRATSDPDET